MASLPAPGLPPILPSAGQPPLTNEAGDGWRKFLWIVLVGLLVAPLAWMLGMIAVALLQDKIRSLPQWLIVVLPVPFALAAAFGVARRGLRRGWPRRTAHLVGWGIAAVGVVTLTIYLISAFMMVRRSSLEKAVQGNLSQLSAATDHFILESGYDRIFLGYDELVGPDRYQRRLFSVAGEDYALMFPVRRDQLQSLPVILPDGRKTVRTENLSIALPNGWTVINGYHDDGEGRKQDGVHTITLPDGRYYKVTYRGGAPDGPFHAYFADGTPWGEATYVHGRVTGPSWLFTRDGRKLDELADGEKAAVAVAASAAAAAKEFEERSARQMKVGKYGGAIDELTRALALNPADLALHRSRGEARQALGDLDGAIEDFCLANGFPSRGAMNRILPDPLLKLFQERSRLRQSKGDTAGAEADLRVIARTLEKAAGKP